MPMMMPPRPMMPPGAPMAPPPMSGGQPRMGGAPPMPQQQAPQPLMDASQMQRQAVIKLLQQNQGPSPDGGLPPQFTMPKPYAPPNPMQRSWRGGY